MTREEAIHKMEYSKRAYQMLIDEKVQEGVLVGQGINGEWSADTPIIDAYKDMLEACDMAIKALEQQPSEDCISRQAVDDAIYDYSRSCDVNYEQIMEFIDKLPSVTPKYTDEEIDKAQAVEQAYVDKMVELAVEETKRPKGKWIEVDVHNFYATLKCSVCGRVIEPYFSFGEYSYEDIKKLYPYCHCGAEMSGGGECNSMAVKSED